MRLWIATILVVATPTAGRAQAEAAHAPTIRVTTSLVQVDVLAQNKRTRLPLSEMKEEDFRVYGDDKEIPIATFYSGQRYSVRPVALWFAVICNQKNWDEYGSGFIRGKTNLLKPALAYLDKADTVGVAHWCDDQTHGIDLEPGRDTDGALAKIEELMRKPPVRPDTRPGELALQGMLRAILASTHQARTERLPVIVFLYGDHSGMYREEIDRVLRDLFETSVIVFGINDGAVPVIRAFSNLPTAQPNVGHFLSWKTGGDFFSVKPELFGTALENILTQVHFRYVLGFKPPKLDGKRHDLRVELTEGARVKYPEAALKSRTEYVLAVNGVAPK